MCPASSWCAVRSAEWDEISRGKGHLSRQGSCRRAISAIQTLLAVVLRGRAAALPLPVSLVWGLLLLSAGSSVANAAEPCPNQAFRTGYSATLPDCRAYELVSPPGIQPHFETFGTIQNIKFAAAVPGAELGTTASQSSAHSGIAFFSTFAPPGSTTDGPYYLSSRGPDGWTTQNLIPPQSTEVTAGCLPYMIAWTPNMERGVLADGFNSPAATCGVDEPELVSGEPRGTQNLFVRDSFTGAYQLIDQRPLSGEPANAIYQGGSSDLTVVAFSEDAPLTPEAPAGTNYYVWAGGTVDRLLTILPNGQPTEGEIVDAAVKSSTNPTSPTFSHAVAPDGSRIEFTAGGNLYSRVNPGAAQSAFNEAGECDEPTKACTVQIDSSETPQPGGGGVFGGGSGESGGVVYFTDANRLTGDSTATAEEPDLYEYDFRKPAGERLTDLTVDQNSGEHADVQGYVGTNETGSPGDYVYFVATGVLASNQNSSGALATPGVPNLYVVHGGARSFIATLSSATDNCDWENRCMSARVSSSGRYLGFDSLEQLTGFNNLDAQTAEPDQEIFLYDGEVKGLSCASCGTTGAAPIAPASIRLPEAVSVPNSPFPRYLQRNVSDNGQVFFDTPTPLVEAVRNEQSTIYLQSNVYEYRDGQLHLLSSGTAESPSYFYDASSDGGDVYLITAQALTPGASSAELSIYDAKVDGGFPAPPPSAEPCSGEGCSGPQASAKQPPSNASEIFAGPGNLHASASVAGAIVKLVKASLADGRRKLLLKVTVSGGGRIVASVKGGRTRTRTVKRAGTYVLQLSTTGRERTKLKHRRRLTLSVTYRAADGTAARVTRTINAKR
jgi:hypothetical protein